MRRVIHIPIIHSAADLGSLVYAVRRRYAQVLGPGAWDRRQQAVEDLWNHIRTKIVDLHLDYANTTIYQDGLPVCGFERRIVEELAKAGSANHQLVLDLLSRGAALMGTEDSQLLIQEYQLHRRQAEDTANAQLQDEANRLLANRDRFIVKRIQETLQPGATGLLFLGAAHKIDSLGDINFETL
jgi:hypothetical protein